MVAVKFKESEASQTPSVIIAETLQNGIPYSFLKKQIEELFAAYPKIKDGIAPKATWARRIKDGRLEARETETILRLQRIIERATQVFGNRDDAIEFLSRKHQLLEDKAPFDVVLLGETGGRVTENLLNSIEFGLPL